MRLVRFIVTSPLGGEICGFEEDGIHVDGLV